MRFLLPTLAVIVALLMTLGYFVNEYRSLTANAFASIATPIAFFAFIGVVWLYFRFIQRNTCKHCGLRYRVGNWRGANSYCSACVAAGVRPE
jgi:hypothetical protein